MYEIVVYACSHCIIFYYNNYQVFIFILYTETEPLTIIDSNAPLSSLHP